MASPISETQATYHVEKCTYEPKQQSPRIKSYHLTSIYNDTNEPIKVDFRFAFSDQDSRGKSIPRGLDQITRSEVTIDSKNWREIYIDYSNEFHPRKGVNITTLFQLNVNGKTIYDNYKYNREAKDEMIPYYEVVDYSKAIWFPCTLKISK